MKSFPKQLIEDSSWQDMDAAWDFAVEMQHSSDPKFQIISLTDHGDCKVSFIATSSDPLPELLKNKARSIHNGIKYEFHCGLNFGVEVLNHFKRILSN